MKLVFTLILVSLSISHLHTQDLDSWLGTYKFEEEPVKTLSGNLCMTMTWDLEVLRGESGYYAILKIIGEQTEMIIKAIVEGKKSKAIFLFDRGLNGFGFEHLTKNDRLFELKMVNGKLITHWYNFKPRLKEDYLNGTSCFRKL